MNSERFEKQLAFIPEADKEKNILHKTHLGGHGRQKSSRLGSEEIRKYTEGLINDNIAKESIIDE